MTAKGWSANDLFRAIVIMDSGLKPTPQYLSEMLTGKIKSPGLRWLSALATALDVTVDALIESGDAGVN